MRIQVRLPQVELHPQPLPQTCPQADCEGTHFKAHGTRGEIKPLRDLEHTQVRAYRYRCLRCGHTFRVYPRGVSRASQSDRLKALSVLMYVLGLSYGAVADVLTALGLPIAKSTVYANVQEAGRASRRHQQADSRASKTRAVIGADATYLKLRGEQVTVGMVVDDRTEELLGLELLPSENTDDLTDFVREIAEAVGAEVLVSDDLDSYKGVADELGLGHQICRSHVRRNAEQLGAQLKAQAARQREAPEGVRSSPERLREDVETLQALVRERPSRGEALLERMYGRYQGAAPPKPNRRASVWYRMRMWVTRLWEGWRRLTLDQRRKDLDGTNNTAERVIGWWLKERYRSMRGYKREASIRNVVTLTARMGARSGAYDMAELYA